MSERPRSWDSPWLLTGMCAARAAKAPPEEIVGHEKRESLSLTVRAEILGWAGYLAGAYSDLDLAVHHQNQSLELLRQSGDRTLLGNILSKLGVIEIFRGNYERAESLLSETISHCAWMQSSHHWIFSRLWVPLPALSCLPGLKMQSLK